MNHSIEFGRSSWAGAQWGNTSLGSSGFSTAARSTPPSLFASNQGEFVTGIFGADLWPVLFFSKTQRLGDLILKHIFVTRICIHRSGFFSGPSVWVTTNQRTYKSEPVMARARWEKESKRIIIVKCNFWMRPVTNVWTIVQRVRSGEERNSQGDRVPEEVGCHRQRRLFATNLSFYSVYTVLSIGYPNENTHVWHFFNFSASWLINVIILSIEELKLNLKKCP